MMITSFFFRLILLSIAMLGLGCEKKGGPKDESSVGQVSESLSSADNGQSYDGKITYRGRENVICDGKSVPKVQITLDSIQRSFKVLTQVAGQISGTDGPCQTLTQENADVEEFRSSQLAIFNGKMNDKLVNIGELVLNNFQTRIVCKLELGPLALLDNQLTGAVVIQTADPSVWHSRLDFATRSEKTNFLFDRSPSGALLQFANTLEFQTNQALPNADVGTKHLMHIRVQRPFVDTLSPSQNYGRKVYPGTFQYFYMNSSVQSPFSISTAAMPSTCFVDQINPDITQVGSITQPYDFVAHILQLFQ